MNFELWGSASCNDIQKTHRGSSISYFKQTSDHTPDFCHLVHVNLFSFSQIHRWFMKLCRPESCLTQTAGTSTPRLKGTAPNVSFNLLVLSCYFLFLIYLLICFTTCLFVSVCVFPPISYLSFIYFASEVFCCL